MSRLYLLDTRYSVNPTQPNNSQWYVPEISLAEFATYKLKLAEAIIPNARYVFRTGVNNVIYWHEDDTVGTADLSATITEGFYTGSTLATEIALRMTNESTASGLGIAYSGTYDTITKKISIAVLIPNQFYIRDGANNCYTEVPFTVSTTLSPTQTSALINISGTLYIDVVSNIGNMNVSTNGTRSVIARIPMDVAGGGIIYYQNTSDEPVQITSDIFETIQIELYDDTGSRFVLPSNTHCSFVLEFIQ